MVNGPEWNGLLEFKLKMGGTAKATTKWTHEFMFMRVMKTAIVKQLKETAGVRARRLRDGLNSVSRRGRFGHTHTYWKKLASTYSVCLA